MRRLRVEVGQAEGSGDVPLEGCSCLKVDRACSAASSRRPLILAWTTSSWPFRSPLEARSCNCCEARMAANAGLWNPSTFLED